MLEMRMLRGVFGLVLLAAAAVAACGSVNAAHRDALHDADAAVKRGDSLGAAHAYRNACRAKPSDRKACQAADAWTQRAVDERLAVARPRCEPAGAGARPDVDGCLAALAPARALAPEHPELLRLANVAGRAHLERCLVDPPDSPDDAVRLARCALARRAAVATAEYEKRLRGATAKAAGVFVDLAARDSTRGQRGAQLALWSAAACLDPDAELKRRHELARRDFLAGAAVPIDVTVQASGADAGATVFTGLCGRVAELLGPRALCRPGAAAPVPTTAAPASAPAAGPAPLALRVSVTVSPTDHRVREESRQFRWQSGVRRFENPARRGVEERVRDAERAFRQADADASERGARCQAARDAWTRAAQEVSIKARAGNRAGAEAVPIA
jgi:hypothetical protein